MDPLFEDGEEDEVWKELKEIDNDCGGDCVKCWNQIIGNGEGNG